MRKVRWWCPLGWPIENKRERLNYLTTYISIYPSIHPFIHPSFQDEYFQTCSLLLVAPNLRHLLSVLVRIAILLTSNLYAVFYLSVVSEDSDVLILVQRLQWSSILTRQCPETKFCSQFVQIIASSAWTLAPLLLLAYQVNDKFWTTENDYCSGTRLVYFIHNNLVNALIN